MTFILRFLFIKVSDLDLVLERFAVGPDATINVFRLQERQLTFVFQFLFQCIHNNCHLVVQEVSNIYSGTEDCYCCSEYVHDYDKQLRGCTTSEL